MKQFTDEDFHLLFEGLHVTACVGVFAIAGVMLALHAAAARYHHKKRREALDRERLPWDKTY